MSNSKNQAADSTTAAAVPSADATPTVGQSAEMREFMRVFMLATPRSRSQICHLIQAHDAGNRRSVFAWLYHWAAFVAINPRAAYRVTPTLRRMTRIAVVAVAVGVMLALMTACSGDNAGSDSSAAALRAKYGATQPAQNDAQPATDQPAPTLAPTAVQISATETPDMQPQSIAAQPTMQPVQISEATQTPQPAVCDPQPMPTVALDATDIAAGVVLRGHWQPCAYATAVAVKAVQP